MTRKAEFDIGGKEELAAELFAAVEEISQRRIAGEVSAEEARVAIEKYAGMIAEQDDLSSEGAEQLERRLHIIDRNFEEILIHDAKLAELEQAMAGSKKTVRIKEQLAREQILSPVGFDATEFMGAMLIVAKATDKPKLVSFMSNPPVEVTPDSLIEELVAETYFRHTTEPGNKNGGEPLDAPTVSQPEEPKQ